jgi:hypothetical protein
MLAVVVAVADTLFKQQQDQFEAGPDNLMVVQAVEKVSLGNQANTVSLLLAPEVAVVRQTEYQQKERPLAEHRTLERHT